MINFKNNKQKKKVFGYIEGIIYIIFTIVVILTNIAGPIEIRLIPFIFLLGIIGRIIYARPIITSIFGFIVAICTMQVIGSYGFTYILMYSLFCFLCILIGEMQGKYIIKFSKLKKISKLNYRDISSFILVFVAGMYLNNYVNGNIYSYLKYKQTLKNHIIENYEDSEHYRILDAKYVFNEYKYYSFNVRYIDVYDNNKYNFAVYSDDRVIDGYKNHRLTNESIKLKYELYKQIDLSKYEEYNFNIEYSNLNRDITIYITKKVQYIDELNMNNFTKEVNNILDDISKYDKFDNITKMKLYIKDDNNILDSEIDKEFFYNTEYYIKSLEVEYIH